MIDLKALYYEKFLPFLVESYAKTIKAAKPGHRTGDVRAEDIDSDAPDG